MTTYTLLLANPPHGDADVVMAAPVLGLAATEVRMKANYQIPEVWLADTDPGPIEQARQTLAEAGFNVVAVPGVAVAEVPAAETVDSFAFSDAGFEAQVQDTTSTVLYDSAPVAVFCQPHDEAGGIGGSAHTGSELTDGLTQRKSGVFLARDTLVGFGGGRRSSMGEEANHHPAFFDVYLTESDAARRLTIREGGDFSGLGDLQMARATDNIAMFATEFEERFSNALIDRRPVNMVARQRPMVVTGGQDPRPDRKGMSFATAALNRLLESISPDLKDLTQFELASRLSYLTRR